MTCEKTHSPHPDPLPEGEGARKQRVQNMGDINPFFILIVAMGVAIAMLPVLRMCGVITSTPPTLFPDHKARIELSELRKQIDDLKRELEEMKQKQ